MWMIESSQSVAFIVTLIVAAIAQPLDSPYRHPMA
jgi:hypothetical protein